MRGAATIRFTLHAPHRVVLDFDQPRDHLLSVKIGDKPVDATFAGGHWSVPVEATKAGENVISIDFLAGDEALNRNDDFLYTLFVPARAHLAFPCFDQPDLKARYSLTLDVPAGWQVVANGAEQERRRCPSAGVNSSFRRNAADTHLSVRFRGRQIQRGDRRAQRPHVPHVSSRDRRAQSGAQPRPAIFDLHAQARWPGWKTTPASRTRGASSISF